MQDIELLQSQNLGVTTSPSVDFGVVHMKETADLSVQSKALGPIPLQEIASSLSGRKAEWEQSIMQNEGKIRKSVLDHTFF